MHASCLALFWPGLIGSSQLSSLLFVSVLPLSSIRPSRLHHHLHYLPEYIHTSPCLTRTSGGAPCLVRICYLTHPCHLPLGIHHSIMPCAVRSTNLFLSALAIPQRLPPLPYSRLSRQHGHQFTSFPSRIPSGNASPLCESHSEEA